MFGLEELDRIEHPGTGALSGITPLTRAARISYLEQFRNYPDVCSKLFRFSFDQIVEITTESAPYLHRPRISSASQTYRSPDTSDQDRVALVLEHIVNPHTALDILANHVGLKKAAMSEMLRNDMTCLIDAMRHELPALIHPDFVHGVLMEIGVLPAALICDTTTTATQRLANSFNAHKHLFGVKSLILVDKDGCLTAVETGFAGAEADLVAFEHSDVYRQIHQWLAPNERIFLWNTAGRNEHCIYPLSRPEIHGIAARKTFVADIAIRRSIVEHAIGEAKARFRSLKELPPLHHTKVEDIINIIFLCWLFEARYKRLNP